MSEATLINRPRVCVGICTWGISVYSPGYFHRAGGSWFICPCPCAVALLCAVSLANNYNRPTAVDAKLSVVHWNVPRISRLPRCVIADIVLASSPSELEDSK